MVDSVVSSHFGKRPLFEVPALQVSNQRSSEVSSLQASAMPYENNSSFPFLQNHIAGPGTHNLPTAIASNSYSMPAWQQNQMGFCGLARNYTAPAGVFYNSQGHQHKWGPSTDGANPAHFYPPQQIYHDDFNHVSGHSYGPQPQHSRHPHPSYGPINLGYNITCDLEYGRIVNIDMRDSNGEFRGVSPFLRTELMRTYGSYPYTKVKVRLEGEEYHIYANHEHRRQRLRQHDIDTQSDRYFDDGYDEEDDRFLSYPERRSETSNNLRRLNNRNVRAKPRSIIIGRDWSKFQ
uniref:Uncharacterized protein n=1 Tax=Arion vulgaris TaxID=1028688 RepID=A0A0B6ZUI1_9EUPU